MPTIRSEYALWQFEMILQKLAHKVAVEAVTKLNKGWVNITINGSKFTLVETDNYTFKFYAGHMSYNVHPSGNHRRYWGFDAEEKGYLTSNHRTKISIWSYQDKEDIEHAKKQIMAFIDKLMAESELKIIPRFALQDASEGR
ncbi:hypothetical protein ES702_03570 [subsurface metagenome]